MGRALRPDRVHHVRSVGQHLGPERLRPAEDRPQKAGRLRRLQGQVRWSRPSGLARQMRSYSQTHTQVWDQPKRHPNLQHRPPKGNLQLA